MRIRSIKPVFWRDRDLARIGDEARLFYIGLWMQADDAGYFRWNTDEIGADLYPFLPEGQRRKKIDRAVQAIGAMEGVERLQVLPCGHARLTRFLDHQKPGGGSRITTWAVAHERCLKALSGQVRTSPDISGVVGRDGTKDGTGQDGIGHAGARDEDPEKDWNDLGTKWGRKKGRNESTGVR